MHSVAGIDVMHEKSLPRVRHITQALRDDFRMHGRSQCSLSVSTARRKNLSMGTQFIFGNPDAFDEVS
jgi:hypothetical protein